MIRELMHDPIFLAQKSEPATKDDLAVAQDLLDTLEANHDRCVGMAANMIGTLKRIIVIDHNGTLLPMLNPAILRQDGAYEAEEGCLSLSGTRITKRFQKIKVQYQNLQMQTRIQTFEGWSAQIIQHELDHCNGILI